MDEIIDLLEYTAVTHNYGYFNISIDRIKNKYNFIEFDFDKMKFILELLNHYNLILTPNFINLIESIKENKVKRIRLK